MKKIIKFIKKHKLKLGLFISILVVLVNEIICNESTDLFYKSYEIGKVFSYLSMAYISSYLFYYVVVVLKEKKDKKNIYTHVYNLTKQLIGRAYSVYYKIIDASKADGTKYDKRKYIFPMEKRLSVACFFC